MPTGGRIINSRMFKTFLLTILLCAAYYIRPSNRFTIKTLNKLILEYRYASVLVLSSLNSVPKVTFHYYIVATACRIIALLKELSEASSD